MNPKILIFIDWYLPGTNSGGPVRSYYNMITQLGHKIDFYIITRNIDYCSENVYENVNSNVWNDSYNNSKVLYLSNSSIKNFNYLRFVEEVSPNTILVNGIYSFFFSILPVLKFKNKFPIILSTRGMLSSQAFTSKKIKKIIFLKLFSFLNIYNNITFHATNISEKNNIIKIFGKHVTIEIISNLPQKLNDTIKISKKNNPTRFINFARISSEKGTFLMLQSLMHVDDFLVLDIFGAIYDEEYWEKCCLIINKLPNNISVNYKGILSYEKLHENLFNYDFMIMLSEGENYGHSIIESLSAGLPVIISDNTPWKELEKNNIGWDIKLSENNIPSFIKMACNTSQEKYNILSKNSFYYAQKICNDNSVLNSYLQLLNYGKS